MKFVKGILERYGLSQKQVPAVEQPIRIPPKVYTVVVEADGAQKWTNNDGSHIFIKDRDGNEVLRIGYDL